jgi:starvation-inducible DNA-binding protein
MSKVRALDARSKSNEGLDTPTDLSDTAVREISEAVNGVLADSFALYLKTKNVHWHAVTRPGRLHRVALLDRSRLARDGPDR